MTNFKPYLAILMNFFACWVISHFPIDHMITESFLMTLKLAKSALKGILPLMPNVQRVGILNLPSKMHFIITAMNENPYIWILRAHEIFKTVFGNFRDDKRHINEPFCNITCNFSSTLEVHLDQEDSANHLKTAPKKWKTEMGWHRVMIFLECVN